MNARGPRVEGEVTGNEDKEGGGRGEERVEGARSQMPSFSSGVIVRNEPIRETQRVARFWKKVWEVKGIKW